jgi:hypothetical protein
MLCVQLSLLSTKGKTRPRSRALFDPWLSKRTASEGIVGDKERNRVALICLVRKSSLFFLDLVLLQTQQDKARINHVSHVVDWLGNGVAGLWVLSRQFYCTVLFSVRYRSARTDAGLLQ